MQWLTAYCHTYFNTWINHFFPYQMIASEQGCTLKSQWREVKTSHLTSLPSCPLTSLCSPPSPAFNFPWGIWWESLGKYWQWHDSLQFTVSWQHHSIAREFSHWSWHASLPTRCDRHFNSAVRMMGNVFPPSSTVLQSEEMTADASFEHISATHRPFSFPGSFCVFKFARHRQTDRRTDRQTPFGNLYPPNS